jgi:hypothetical protein
VFYLAVADPFRHAFEVGAEERTDTVGVLETLYVNGQSREDLQDAVEKYPASEAGFAGRRVFEVGS